MKLSVTGINKVKSTYNFHVIMCIVLAKPFAKLNALEEASMEVTGSLYFITFSL
jgi:hypothetical protein